MGKKRKSDKAPGESPGAVGEDEQADILRYWEGTHKEWEGYHG